MDFGKISPWKIAIVVLIVISAVGYLLIAKELDPRCSGQIRLQNGCDCNYYFTGETIMYKLFGRIGNPFRAEFMAPQNPLAICKAKLAMIGECYSTTDGKWLEGKAGVKMPVCDQYYVESCSKRLKGTSWYDSESTFNCGKMPV
ncbi:MAG: hypothetical protein AABX01_01165 [Candidatus Micrarchaeota archaeon]